MLEKIKDDTNQSCTPQFLKLSRKSKFDLKSESTNFSFSNEYYFVMKIRDSVKNDKEPENQDATDSKTIISYKSDSNLNKIEPFVPKGRLNQTKHVHDMVGSAYDQKNRVLNDGYVGT